MCRRPETDYRLQILHAARAAATMDVHTPPKEVKLELTSSEKSPAEQKPPKQHKMMDVNTDEVTMVSGVEQEVTPAKTERAPLPSATPETRNSSSDVVTRDGESALVVEDDDDEVQVVEKMKDGD